MPPKRGTSVARKPDASMKEAASSSSSPPPSRPSSAGGSRAAAAAARKREHEEGTSGESPVKKKEAIEEPSHCLFLCGFTPGEMKTYQRLLKHPWTIEETLTGSVTHVVIKSMGAIKTSQQLLPIYYAVLKGLWMLKPSFLPISSWRRKSLSGVTPLEKEVTHEYHGREIFAPDDRARTNFPSIVDIVRIRAFILDLKEEKRPPILGSAPFKKVAILAGRSKESKQRREELKLVMEAGGATVIEDTVFKAWKAKRKKGGDIEKPSMVVIVNGEKDVSSVGLDDDIIRDLLKARAPLFYEEFITEIFMHTQMMLSLDDLLLQCFVFIHEQMKSVDPDGKLQRRVLDDEDDDVSVVPSLAEKTPSGRRLNSRASSSARESNSSEQVGMDKRKGKREKEEEKKEEGEEGKPPRGRSTKKEDKEKEGKKVDEKMEEDTPKAAPKKGGRPRKGEETKDVKKEEGEEMEVDDVDPSLTDDNIDLLAEFEREIEDRNERGGREERSEREMRELREMREDRGDEEEEEEGEAPVTPEPILFSQLASQPEIEIPEELRKALEVKEDKKEGESDQIKKEGEEDVKYRRALSSTDTAIPGEGDMSDDGSDTVVEDDDDIDDEDETRSVTPYGDEPSSEYGGNSAATITLEDAKECETCNDLGTQHLYFNQQMVADIEQHFSSPRLEWFDFIIEVKQRMPWMKPGEVQRPNRKRDNAQRQMVTDLFYTFYHEMRDEDDSTLLLSEVNSCDAMGMYEAEWEEEEGRRPTLDLMLKMLHEFAAKGHSEDLGVPERACSALKNALPVILPYSPQGRHYWLTIIAGGTYGIKGRANQIVEEMARRCKTFFIKTLVSGCFDAPVIDFVAYFCEVDLFCAQTPFAGYEKKKKNEEGEEESMDSQKPKGKKRKMKKNPLENFPLVLLLIMELDESPRRGISESAILMIQKMMEIVVTLKRYTAWGIATSLQRAVLCLLEAARWHCGQAASSALTGAERRRVKAVESANQNNGVNITVELQQNIKTIFRWILKRPQKFSKKELRESLPICWLEDIIDAME